MISRRLRLGRDTTLSVEGIAYSWKRRLRLPWKKCKNNLNLIDGTNFRVLCLKCSWNTQKSKNRVNGIKNKVQSFNPTFNYANGQKSITASSSCRLYWLQAAGYVILPPQNKMILPRSHVSGTGRPKSDDTMFVRETNCLFHDFGRWIRQYERSFIKVYVFVTSLWSTPIILNSFWILS